jgi:integrase
LRCITHSHSRRNFFSLGHLFRASHGGKGRNQARQPSELSFHSLRHSAVTMLKRVGVSDFVARDIVGHESAAISRHYTHLTPDDLRSAMQRLPDVTNA